MVDDRHARLRRARIDSGYPSAQAAADAYGWPVAAYRHHENGTRSFDFATAQRYGKAFKKPAAWLMGEDSAAAKGAAAHSQPPPQPVDTIEIQEWNYAYGMGGGTFNDLPVTGELHQFSPGWLRQFTYSPAHKVFLARGTGDSMTPTIQDSDVVLIDTSEREVRTGDRIWALAIGSVGYIKRLRPMPDGSVKILSDNPSVPPETAYDGEMSIVGRVVAIVRKT